MQFDTPNNFSSDIWGDPQTSMPLESKFFQLSSAYPTPAHSDYSADPTSNRSSLGNLFDPQSMSIWSTNSHQLQDLNSWEPLSKTSSQASISTSNSNSNLTHLFPTSPSLSTIKLQYDEGSLHGPFGVASTATSAAPAPAANGAGATAAPGNVPYGTTPQFRPFLFNEAQLTSPSSTQINLNRGIQEDVGGQLRNQLMQSITKRQQNVSVPQVTSQAHTQRAQSPTSPQSPRTLHIDTPATNHANSHTNHKTNKSLFKTEMCAKFQATGSCPYNTKCQFAHGIEELKASSKPKNWKTKLCRSWELNGYCSYGKRCCYKHGQNDTGATVHLQQPPPQVLRL